MTTPAEDCDCEEAKAQLDAFRRGELTTAQVGALGRHLDHCKHCKCLQQYEAAFLDRLRAIGAAECCPERLRAKVGELLANPGWNA